MYNAAVSSAVMSSLHGMNIAALVQPWSVIVSMESKLSRTSSFIRFSELEVLIIRYDKMVSHMMPHVH
jgi:hypothetical protein